MVLVRPQPPRTGAISCGCFYSGDLDREEVHALVVDLYGKYMAVGELERAGKDLYEALDADGDGEITLEELYNRFLTDV